MEENTTKVEGTTESGKAEETKTEETKTESIEELKKQIADLARMNEKLKQANTKASSEAAKFKKDLQAKMTDDEKALESQKALQEELETLKREKAIATDKAKLLSVGFGEDDANDFAESLSENDKDKLFNSLKNFIESHDKEVAAERVSKMPNPKSGQKQETAKDYDLNTMSYADIKALKDKNPSLYNELMNKK